MNDTPTGTARAAAPTTVLQAWPALQARLADRAGAFVDLALGRAREHGLADAPVAAARYLNLCCALGPGFEHKPENEWALALLADERLRPEVKLHQLVRRARLELRRRGSADESELARTDAALLDAMDRERLAAEADAAPLPRMACDIEAIELRLLDTGFRAEYRIAPGADGTAGWARVPLGEPLPVRIAAPAALPAGQAPVAPPLVAALSLPPADGPGARLQLRQARHAGCAGDRHPALHWLDARGISRLSGPAAQQALLDLPAPTYPAAAGTPLPVLAEETAPSVSLLQLPSCGLRDDGVPLGAQNLQVWTYPATQWLWVLQRDAAEPGAAPPATRCLIERDGRALASAPMGASSGAPAAAWQRGFDEALPAALATAWQRLAETWQAQLGSVPRLQCMPSFFSGRQWLSWGWREGPQGLGGEALLRLVGQLDLGAALALQLEGEWQVGGARSVLRLAVQGQARHTVTLQRERPEPALAALAGSTVLRFSWPFHAEVDPIAGDDGVVCSEVGPCEGSLGGELGLRPRMSGGSGWQWYLRLASDAVMLPLTVHDPVLGLTRRKLMLLPALQLADWSLG